MTSATRKTSARGLPRVVIVGRPNVGKSTLANRMCGSRVSIVEPTAGVTRDRVAVPARLETSDGPCWVEVIDTGGIGVVDRDDLGPLVEEQIRTAIASADVILWLVDVREGITPLDQEVARWVRGLPVPVVLVANKAEGKYEHETGEFHALGMSDGPHAVSAQNGDGITDLFDHIKELLPPDVPNEAPTVEAAMKVAVIGRRNAGKSTLINSLAREDRMIVSEIAGTTRDAVDVMFERDGRTLIAIDTAGVRKKKSHEDAIEFYSDARSHKSIRRADVVVLLFDVAEKLSQIEKNLARYAIDHYKPLILGANKWDLVEGFEPEDFREYLEQELPSATFAPTCFLSAKTGQGVDELLALADELFAQARRRVSTGDLNRVLARALEARAPNSGGHAARVRYATQAEVAPPTFVLFVNDKKHFGKDYMRYLSNRLRDELDFPEIPLRIVLRDGSHEEAEERRDS